MSKWTLCKTRLLEAARTLGQVAWFASLRIAWYSTSEVILPPHDAEYMTPCSTSVISTFYGDDGRGRQHSAYGNLVVVAVRPLYTRGKCESMVSRQPADDSES